MVQSERTITRFQTQKTGALLAYLALNLNASHSREVLAELLWPGADPIAVRNRLNQAVSSLRRQIEPPGITHGSVLITDQRTIRLNPESIETDVQEFGKRIEAADLSPNPEEKVAHLKRAIDIYAGEFLTGMYAEWITMEQLRFADMYSGALFELFDVSRDVGDTDQAIRAATLLLKEDPTDEGTHCDLMQIYIDAGRPAAAKRQFEELTRILAAEGEEPSDEAVQLSRQASMRRPATLRPLQAPMKATNLPTMSLLDAAPCLPTALNRFVGREHEVVRLKELLTQASTRLVTILGVGGSGKTRLALQTAMSLQDVFSKNIYFVPLADLQDPDRVHVAIADAIGIREIENVTSRLRQNNRTLLILDNFEHLVESAALILQSLLVEVPTLSCLATSRCAIRIEGERCYSLSPLPVPAETDSVADLIANPSVALFVDRAQAALPDFQLTPRNAQVVRQLCECLEGLPLAIELAASWAKTVAPSQMLAMLSDRFRLLESRRRDISARHRTMRAVIDSSVALLSPDLKSLFLRLSVFNGGWTLQAAAEVCQRPDVLQAMDELHEQSLVLIDDFEGETLRFRMLDTLRAYAQEHLPAAEAVESENLHAGFYSAMAEHAFEHMEDVEQLLWTDRIDSDTSNLSAAFNWYLAHDLYEPALVLASNLAPYWEVKGRTREGRSWIERCLTQHDESQPFDPRLRATALTHLARLAWIQGDFEAAAKWHQDCLDSWLDIGDARGIFHAVANVQQEAHRTRNYGLSVELLEQNLVRAKSLGDNSLIARCWLALGNTSVEQRRFDFAEHCYGESLKAAREAENRRRTAHALNNLGNLAMLQNQRDLARDHLLQALSLFQATGSQSQMTGALLLLTRLERLERAPDAAERWITQARAYHPEETYHIQRLFLEYAHLAALKGGNVLAATLLGFVEQHRKASGGLNYDVEKDELDALVKTIQSALGGQAFSEAYAVGKSLDQAEASKRLDRNS